MFPGGDMQDLLKKAQQMQEDYLQAQQELNESEVTAAAGGGLVSATVSGASELIKVSIDPKAVDPEDVESLEDLVLAAVKAANDEAKQIAEEKLGPISDALGGMGGGGGMGLPGM